MRIAIRIGVLMLLWTPVLFFAGQHAFGLSSSDFSGFDLGAKATAAQFTFDSPSLGIPATPTGELDLAFSQSTLQSGPAGYGLGSILWPGQVAAALPSFLQGEIENNSKQKLPVNIPNYPIRAESFYPQGPTSASIDAGTMHMRSSARDTYSEGVAYANQFGFPGIGTFGTQSSMSSSGFDPSGAVSIAEADANKISLIAGLVTIDSVVTRATARSDGDQASVAGTTVVAGASIKGVGDVTIDTTGVHVAGQGIDTAAAQQSLDQVLKQFGMSMQVAPPVDTIQGAKATRALGGLFVQMKSSVIEPLVSALPSAIQSQIRAQITFDQVFTIAFAPVVVSAGAAKNLTFPVIAPTIPTTVGASGTSNTPSTTTTTSETPVGDTGYVAPPSTTSGAPTTLAAAPVTSSFKGLPVWVVVLLAFAALIASRPLMALTDRLLSARAGVGACPDEAD